MKKVLNILLLALVTIVLSVSCSQEVTVDSNFYENNETGTFTVDGRGFATLQDAIDYVRGSRAINDSNTIKLTKNASGPGANVDGSLELCIDFQGYTFSFTNVTGKQGENVSDKSFGLSITDGATVSLKGLQEISLYDSTTNLTMVYVEGSDTSLTIEDSPKMVVEDDQYVFWAANGATLTIGSDSATDTEAFISGKIAATGTTEKKPTVAIKSKTTITGTIQATSANVALYGSSSVAGAIEASASSISINQTSKINASLSAKDASVVVVNTSNSDAGTITTMDKDGGSTVVVSGGTVKIDEIAEGSDTQVEVGGGGTVTSSEITRRDASYVAIIENKLYETLQGAVDAAKAGDTVVLLKDVSYTEPIGFTKNITAILDLNGKTLKVTGGAGTYGGGRAIKMEAGNLTIKNGTIDGRSYDGEILNPHSSGTGWSSTRVGGCLRVSGGSATLDNVTMYNNDSWGSGIMMESKSGTLTVNNCTFSSLYGTSITCGDYNTETLSTGYNAVTNIYNCTFTQEGIPTDDMNFNAACLASQYGATINVYGDTRATGENAFAIFSSGGEINVYGGTYSAKHYIVNSYGVQEGIYYGVYANVAQVNLYDGTFTDLNTDVAFKFNNDNHNAILITGGTFNVNPYPKVNHETHDVWKNDETSVKYIVVEKNASHEGYNTQVTN